MSVSRFQRVKSLFRDALDVAENERLAFCEAQCDDGETLNDLLHLLDAHDTAAEFLDSPLSSTREHRATRSDAASDRWLGKSIDNFQIESLLGSGGNAAVYRAVQQNPTREVALKLLHASVSDPLATQRFCDESQVLAELEHPGIARVLASGSFDDDGQQRNWFAMELIRGLPLNEYVETNTLDRHQKLELFQRICQAVEHAHQRSVIHRDLKPSNIMVTEEGGPVVVDFGIARVTHNPSSERSMTASGTVLGTLTHMSPEQLCGDVDSVTAASDVYSLGVIGYELLTGTPPLEMRRGSLRDVVERGLNEDPVPLGKIDRTLRGDLEAVFETALHKEPSRRYVSAAAMAKDIGDYLDGHGVSVKRANAVERSFRFVKRNRGPVVAATSLLAVAVTGAVFYASAAATAKNEAKAARIATANARREADNAERETAKAQYEAEKANAINSFITNDLMTNLVGGLTAAQKTPREAARKMLSVTSDKTSAMFGDRPAIEAAIRNELGTMHYNFGQIAEASEQYQNARRLWQQTFGSDHHDTLKAVNNLALCLMRQGKAVEAEPLFRDTLAKRISVLGESHEQTLATMNNLAQALFTTARPDQATQLMTAAYDIQLKESGFENKQSLIMAANLASMLLHNGQNEAALELNEAAYHGCCEELGKEHVTTLTAGFRYAKTLHQLERFEQAADVLLPVQESTIRVLGTTANATLTNHRLLARIEKDCGNPKTAITILKQAIADANSTADVSQEIVAKLKRDLGRLTPP